MDDKYFEEYYKNVTEVISWIIDEPYHPDMESVMSMYKNGISFCNAAHEVYKYLRPEEDIIIRPA